MELKHKRLVCHISENSNPRQRQCEITVKNNVSRSSVLLVQQGTPRVFITSIPLSNNIGWNTGETATFSITLSNATIGEIELTYDTSLGACEILGDATSTNGTLSFTSQTQNISVQTVEIPITLSIGDSSLTIYVNQQGKNAEEEITVSRRYPAILPSSPVDVSSKTAYMVISGTPNVDTQSTVATVSLLGCEVEVDADTYVESSNTITAYIGVLGNLDFERLITFNIAANIKNSTETVTTTYAIRQEGNPKPHVIP